MPSPDPDQPFGVSRPELGSINTDLCQLVAAAADLCRKPLRHGVRLISNDDPCQGEPFDCCLRLEARSADGVRLPEQDLELEIYRSGNDLNLMISWLDSAELPVLWVGHHPLWMNAKGDRCACPDGGVALEALCRRIRTLLGELSGTDREFS